MIAIPLVVSRAVRQHTRKVSAVALGENCFPRGGSSGCGRCGSKSCVAGSGCVGAVGLLAVVVVVLGECWWWWVEEVVVVQSPSATTVL